MKTELIVMLTYNDRTVEDAKEIFLKCKDIPVKYWGFKELGIPVHEMKELCKIMKESGKTTFLEVVEYSEEKGMEGAKMAVECGFDVLMGTIYYEKINDYCKNNGLKYMPFIGNVKNRPSVVDGTIDEIIEQGKLLEGKGVFGIDLLGYRYIGDAKKLNKKAINEIDLPICLAGSIGSYERLDEVKEASPWAFTIGTAFFEKKFGESFADQIVEVINYLEK